MDPIITMLPFLPSAMTRLQIHLRAKPLAAQIHVREARPLLVGQFEERHDGLDAGVIYQYVDRPQFLPDPLDHGFDFGAAGDIRLDCDGAAAFGAYPRGDILGGLSAGHVVDGDVGAFLREHLRYAFADSTAGTRNQRHLTF